MNPPLNMHTTILVKNTESFLLIMTIPLITNLTMWGDRTDTLITWVNQKWERVKVVSVYYVTFFITMVQTTTLLPPPKPNLFQVCNYCFVLINHIGSSPSLSAKKEPSAGFFGPHPKTTSPMGTPLHADLPQYPSPPQKPPSPQKGNDSPRSSECSSSTTPPLLPSTITISHPPSTATKFKDLLLPPPARTASAGSSSSSMDETHLLQPPPPPQTHTSLSRTNSELNLKEKYGNLSSVLGKGAFATVKLCCPVGGKEKYAVKEFRKKKKDETNVKLMFLF